MRQSQKFLVASAALTPVIFGASGAWAAAIDPQKGITLWEVIKAGGFIVWVLFFLSVIAVALIIYAFKLLKFENFAPKDFTDRAKEKIDAHDFDGLKKLTKGRDQLIPQMVSVGLDRRAKGRNGVQGAMELYAQSEVNKLWQLLGYLSDLATIAPLVGLLGTALGIIKAFSAFSHHAMALKLEVLAQGVSLALVSTAGGLFVAIPIMFFYSYLKPKVQQLVTDIELAANDITDNILRHI